MVYKTVLSSIMKKYGIEEVEEDIGQGDTLQISEPNVEENPLQSKSDESTEGNDKENQEGEEAVGTEKESIKTKMSVLKMFRMMRKI